MGALILVLIVVFSARLWQYCVFTEVMGQVPAEGEQDREGHGQPLSLLAGFSLAAVTAIASQDPEQPFGKALDPAKAHLLWSFLFQLASLNLQHYKAFRWQDSIGGGLSDLAMLTLAIGAWHLATVTLVDSNDRVVTYVLIVILIGFDRVLRFRFECQALAGLKSLQDRNGKEKLG